MCILSPPSAYTFLAPGLGALEGIEVLIELAGVGAERIALEADGIAMAGLPEFLVRLDLPDRRIPAARGVQPERKALLEVAVKDGGPAERCAYCYSVRYELQ